MAFSKNIVLSRYNINGKFYLKNIGILWIYGNYNLLDYVGEINIISSSFKVKNLTSRLSIDYGNIDANVILRGKILGDLLNRPSYNISLLLKDLVIDNLNIDRISINLKGNDLSNSDTSISGKYRNNLFWAKGKFDLLKLRGDLRGRLSWNDFIKFSPYFNWKGDLSSWIFEIYSRNNSLKINNYSFKISEFRLILNNSKEIDAYLLYLERGNYIYAGVQGTLSSLNFVLWGENVEILGNKLKGLSLTLNNNLLGKINIKLEEEHVINGDLKLSLDERQILLKNVFFNNYKLGSLNFDFGEDKLDLEGSIFNGKVSGYYSFDRMGVIKFSDLKFENINLNGEIDIDKDYLRFLIPQIDLYGVSFKDISGKIEFNKLSEIKDINILGPYDLKIHGDLKIEKNLLSVALNLMRKEVEIGKLWGRGNLERFDIKGLLFNSSVNGVLDISKNTLDLRINDLNLHKIDDSLEGVIDKIDVLFENENLYFKGESKAISLKSFTLQDIVFKGEYKKDLTLELNAKYNSFKLTIDGFFNFEDKNKFTLFLEPKLDSLILDHILKLKFNGEIFNNFKNYKLYIVEHNIKGLLEGYISIDLDMSLINGKITFDNDGGVDIGVDLEGNGNINFDNLLLALLKNFDLKGFKGSVSGNVKVKNWNIEKVDIEGKNLSYVDIPVNIDSSIEVKKESDKYLVIGEIRKVSNKPGFIKGKITSNGFDFIVGIDNFKIIENFVPKNVYYGDISNMRLQLEISGDLSIQKIKGSVVWNEPIMIIYVREKIKNVLFEATYKDNRLILDDLEISGFNNVVKLYGNILPTLDIDVLSKALCLTLPGLFNGYVGLDLKLLKDKDRYKIGGVVNISNGHIYYPQNMNISGISFEIPIDLDLNLIVGDNVVFSENNFIYASLLGNITVKGSIIRPILEGRVNFVYGSINVLGHDFVIKEGYIKFPGLSFQENIWEIYATKNIQGYNITLKGINFIGNTSFTFSSEPYLSFREILFLLLGQKNLPIAQRETWTLSTLIESIPVGVEGIISTAFGNYILYPILSELEKLLSLDKIKIEYTLEGFIPKWKNVSLEKRILNNLFFTLSYSLGESKLWGAELGYQFNKNLYFKIFTSEKGDFSLSFEYKTQF